MRHFIAAMTICLLGFPATSEAQQPVPMAAHAMPAHSAPVYSAPIASVHTGGTCACGHVYQPAPVVHVAPVAVGCGGCGGYGGCGGGCGGCGNGLCNNWPEFYNRLYADFYANNQWYVIAKQKENAARLARLRGLPEPEEVKAPK